MAIDGSTKGVDGDYDILQFSAPIYFVEKNEGILQIDVMRLGHLRGRVCASFFTMDGSAKAGLLYQESRGAVVIEDGESDTSVQIPIINNNIWAPTLEFKVGLKSPDNCVLGKYLHTCRVKIIDRDLFPSSKYRKQIEEGDKSIARIPGVGLLWEYCKLNFKTKGMKRRTILTLLMGQLQNLYFFFTTYVTIYLVDDFFKTPSDQLDRIPKFFFKTDITGLGWDENQTAIWIGVAYAAPMLLLHLWDYIEVKMDIRGASRFLLQSSLFRKYLNYSEWSRAQVLSSDMQIAVLQDSDALATTYVSLLHLSRSFGKLGVMIYFIAVTNIQSMWILGAMCALMCLFSYCRSVQLTKVSDLVNLRLAEIGGLVSDTCQRYRLVADYAQRPQVNERFSSMVEDFRAVDVPAEVVKLNNSYFPKWLGPVFIGIFIAFDGPKVFTTDITLGNFIACLGIFNQVSLDFEALYKEVLEVTQTIGLLRSFTVYFNLPTDLVLWKSINRMRREMTAQARSEVLNGPSRGPSLNYGGAGGDEDCPFRSDAIPIKVDGMVFSLGGLKFVDVNLSVQQGRLLALVGPHGAGKATFLRLLAHALFPDKGSIFIPTHLRILHVTQEPLMMYLSLWRNLTFGCPNPADVDSSRVKLILERLKMHKTLSLIAADLAHHPQSYAHAEVGTWQEQLTYTEKVKVHIARALIVNVEMMILQRPLHHFEATSAELILSTLKKHVLEKGLYMPQGNAGRHRRPRTCVFSPETVEQARQADVIWQISKVGSSSSTVHLALPKDLQDGFERGLDAAPMSLMNPTVALHMNDGARRNRQQAAAPAIALSDQIINQL